MARRTGHSCTLLAEVAQQGPARLVERRDTTDTCAAGAAEHPSRRITNDRNHHCTEHRVDAPLKILQCGGLIFPAHLVLIGRRLFVQVIELWLVRFRANDFLRFTRFIRKCNN